MAISLTTDWSKLRYIMFVMFSVSVLLASTVANGLTTSGKKRQLFREHLLPGQGGKIPDGAFTPHRIFLNKFNQNGLFSTDGWHLEQRNPNDAYLPKRYLPNTIKITLAPDNRYVAPPGRYYAPQEIDTTYLIRRPVPINFEIFPPIFRGNYLPAIAQDSLRLIRRFKVENVNNDNNNHNTDAGWNQILHQSQFPHQILGDLAPYLKKLEEES